jgi:hypothetical protein
MVSLLLIIFYTTIFIFWLLKISRSYRNYLSAQQVALSFVTKIAFGLAYGFLFWKFYKGDDTWQYHNFSLTEYQNLLHHPGDFILDIRSKANGSTSLHSIYDTTNSFWNKFDDVLLIKLLTIFDLFSFGHYYVNVVLFGFVVYLGHFLIFRLLVHYYPQSAPLLIAAIFYNPMITFWLSGIRKEGVLFLALALVLFYFDRLLRKQGNLIINALFIFTGLGVLLVMRNFVVMCLAPSLLGLFFCRRFQWNAPLTFTAVYSGCIVAFFMSSTIPGLPNLPAKVAQRQYEFLSLTANTRLSIDSLKGTPASFLQVLPQAINHSFLRPYITESKGILQVISAGDILLFFLMALITALFHKDDWKKILQNPIVLTCFFTSLFAYLLIGYTVPFPGTFIRYKAIFELLFVCIFAIITDLNKIERMFINKK